MKDPKKRFGIGAGLIAFVVLVLVFDRSRPAPLVGPLVAALLGLVALLEFLRLAAAMVPRPLATVAAGVGTALLGCVLLPPDVPAATAGLRAVLALPAVFFVLAVAALLLRFRSAVLPGDFAAVGVAFAGILVTTFPAALLAATMRLVPEGVIFTFVVVFGSKLNDMGGYLIGSTLGRHKLCPGISPNKTWEGALGGLVLGVLGTLALVRLTPLAAHLGGGEALVLGLLLGITTQAGDLFESLLKRSVGVKDSAAILPAFGGILDLVDSFIFAAPVGYTLGRLWLEGA